MLAVNILISVFGVASSFSPNYYVLLLLRGIVGFGIGGGILGYVCVMLLRFVTKFS